MNRMDGSNRINRITRMKTFVPVLLVFILLFGCINLDFLGGKQEPAKTNATNETIQKNETGKVVIISQTNTTAINNGSETSVKPPKPSGMQYTETPNDVFAVYFISVAGSEGQGDAILIKKGDADILIDAGPNKNGAKTIDFLKSRNIDDIELLVSTHADPEHYNGIYALLDKYDVEEFWWPGNAYSNNDYSDLVSKLYDSGVPVKAVSKGDGATINGISLYVLNPSKKGTGFGGTDSVDNDAIVIKVVQDKFCLLLTSDIAYGAQTLLATSTDVKCEILQIPYHGLGKGNSQIDTFLLKVAPKYAIISGGVSDQSADKKGTRLSLYEKLKLRGIKYFENYKNGTVKITSDGSVYDIQFVN